MKKTLFALIALVLFLVACTQNTPGTKETTQDDTTVDTTADIIPDTTQEITKDAVDMKPETTSANPDIVKMFDRLSQIKSYSFTIANLPDMGGRHTYSIKGDKIRIDVLQGLYEAGGDIDVVFLDTTKKTAAGYCLQSASCDTPNNAVTMDYDKWMVVPPTEWVSQIKTGTKSGSLTFFNRPVTKVKYSAGGKYYEAYIDNYYGMPLRIAIATDKEMTKIVGGYEYRTMAFNTVKDDQIVHIDVAN